MTEIYAPKQETSSTIPDSSATDSRLSWQQQKELQAAKRKKENALKKVEEEIETLETRDSEIDELMALPENAVNVAKCVEFSKEKALIAERLEELYAQWETLSEEM